MDKPTKADLSRKYSSNYYYSHQETIRRKRVLALMAKGHSPKPSTMEKYQLVQPQEA